MSALKSLPQRTLPVTTVGIRTYGLRHNTQLSSKLTSFVTLKRKAKNSSSSSSDETLFPGLPWLVLGSTAFSASPALNNAFIGSDPASLATALGLLTVIVAVHESGHFLAARLQDIHVSKFSIGFGPTILRYQSKIVEYSIRAIPLGGFVAFPDDDPNSPFPKDDPNLLRNRPILDRAIVVSAGVIANFLFAYSILLGQIASIGITREVLDPGVLIPAVIENSVAEKAGILPGDLILSIDGKEAAPNPATVPSVVNEISSHPEKQLTFEIKRDGEIKSLIVTPSIGPDGEGQIGVQLLAKKHFASTKASSPFNAAQLAFSELNRLTNEILNGLKNLIFNFSQTADRVSGPIAVIAMGAQVARLNVSQLYLFAAVVNLNLAVVNILPLPALDGGYLALLLLELIRGGKKLPQNVEQGVMASGILFLVVLGCLLLVRDTVNLGLL